MSFSSLKTPNKKVASWVVVGIATKLVGAVMFTVLYGYFYQNVLAANLIVACTTPLLNYFLHKKITFRNSNSQPGTFRRYIITLTIALALDSLLTWALISYTQQVFLSKLLSTCSISIAMFVILNRFVFGHKSSLGTEIDVE